LYVLQSSPIHKSDTHYCAYCEYVVTKQTSHDGGLVDLFPESHKSSDVSTIVDC